MKDEPSNYPLTLRRGESRSIVFTYGPRDRTLPRHDLTGFTIEMRIRPEGAAVISYTSSPGISITDAENGEITIDIDGETIEAYEFQNAPYMILLDGERLIYGTVTVRSLYE